MSDNGKAGSAAAQPGPPRPQIAIIHEMLEVRRANAELVDLGHEVLNMGEDRTHTHAAMCISAEAYRMLNRFNDLIVELSTAPED